LTQIQLLSGLKSDKTPCLKQIIATGASFQEPYQVGDSKGEVQQQFWTSSFSFCFALQALFIAVFSRIEQAVSDEEIVEEQTYLCPHG
jgi:hypothetical protein